MKLPRSSDDNNDDLLNSLPFIWNGAKSIWLSSAIDATSKLVESYNKFLTSEQYFKKREN